MIESPILALADDLTGALETGAKFSGAGIGSVVSVGTWPGAKMGALVVDTETRHDSAGDAYRKVHSLAEAARSMHPRLIYKKTDSTLRGNIECEFRALIDVFGGPLFYAPAYPQMGRTVKGGCLYVDGVPVSESDFARDALNPIRESDVRRLVPDEMVRILDGEIEEDVRAAAQLVVSSTEIRLAAGPAGFAGYIAEWIDAPRASVPRLPAVKRCLIVNGSRHEVSIRQMRHAGESGIPTVSPEHVGEAIRLSGWAILCTDGVAGEGPARAQTVGRVVRGVLDQVELDALVLIGGDTAMGLLHALGRPPLTPVREVIPGMPLSRAGLCPALITKAGGFGAVDVLTQVRILLEGER